jgi:conjugal transfer pilus assembly protein TraV
MDHHFADTRVLPILKSISASAFVASLCLSLCACSTTSETFDCPSGKGVGCKSISEVNQMVDRGTLGRDAEEGKQSILPLQSLSAPIMATDPSAVERDKASAKISLSDTMAVHRAREEHLRVWIAPFQDEQGNLHEGSIIHTVLKPGYWQLKTSPQRGDDSRVDDSRVSDPTNLDSGEVD